MLMRETYSRGQRYYDSPLGRRERADNFCQRLSRWDGLENELRRLWERPENTPSQKGR